MKRITDPQGVSWFELDIKTEMGRAPIEAFGIGAVPFMPSLQKEQEEYNKNEPLFINK